MKVHTLTGQTWQFNTLDAAVEAFDLNLNATSITGTHTKQRKHTPIGTVDLKGAGHIALYWCHDEGIIIDSLGNNLYQILSTLPVDTVTLHGHWCKLLKHYGNMVLYTGSELDEILSQINGRKTGNIYIAKEGTTANMFNEPIKLA